MSAHPQTPDPRRWWTLGAVCVATFMLLLDVTIVNVALPDIQKDLGGLVDRRRQDVAVPGQREVRGLDLQRGAQLVERDDRVGVQAGDARSAVWRDRDEALVGQRAQRRANGVARGAVGIDEIGLDQPRTGV